jgi:hypothetical protein
MPGTAFVADLRHDLRDQQRGRDAVFGEGCRRRGDHAGPQPRNFLVAMRPQARQRRVEIGHLDFP